MAAPASLLDLQADIDDLAARLASALAILEEKLVAETWTVRDLRGLRASLAGVDSDIGEVRSQLDAADVTTYLIADSAERRIQLWRWERETRKRLVRLRGQVAQADAIAAEVEAGQARTRHAVRSGETLQSIAAAYLGDWREWPRLAAANGLAAGTVTPGTVLIIPAKA